MIALRISLVVAIQLAGWLHPKIAAAQTATVLTSINNISSGQCLEAFQAQKTSGAAVVQSPCHGSGNQQWELVPASSEFLLRNKNSQHCLAVRDSSTAAGAAVEQTTCNSAAGNQRWAATKVDRGWTLKVAHTGMCLDNPGSSPASGASMIQYPCHEGPNQVWYGTLPAASPFNNVGQWSSLISLPIVPSSAALMADGKVALWSGSGPNTFGAGARTFSTIFDPATGAITETVITNTNHEYFCEGTNFLADGSLVMTGGTNATRTSAMNSRGQWLSGPELNIPRGYSSSTLTSSGKVFTLGGSWSGGNEDKKGELLTPGGRWTVLANVLPDDFMTADPTGAYRADNHMWLFGSRDGWVFHAGPSRKMHWINTAGVGSVVYAGLRGDDSDAMNGNFIPYDINKILTVGGAPSYDKPTPTNNAFILDLAPGPAVAPYVKKLGSMKYARTFANSVVLPNGDVAVFGGVKSGGNLFSDFNSVLIPEIWNPTTANFTSLAPMTTPRNYHSFALLLLDGSVLVGGGGQCGKCTTNHPDAQIFKPPYLLNPDGASRDRPTLSSAPTTATHGETITVDIGDSVSSLSLVRMSSVTHSLNTDQRRVPLPIVRRTATSATLRIPANRGLVLSGNYMLFAMKSDGTPSVAKVINIR